MMRTLAIEVKGKGLQEITAEVSAVVKASGIRFGLCSLFLQHTSASLLIQENADPAVRRDLERWLNRLVPEGDALYTHTEEGADDMPAHIKTALTAVSLSIPVVDWALALGRWQGIFLWEHRRFASQRHLVVHLSS
jgi:secondary thiamine-phosphate synthase enzyme